MSAPSTPRPHEGRTIPARFIGAHPVLLDAGGGPYFDASGVRRETLLLSPGETLRIYPQEAYGQTLLWTRTGNPPCWTLGYGQVVLEDHAALSDAELAAAGYEFQSGRADFEPLVTLEASESRSLLDLHSPDAAAATQAAAEAAAQDERRKSRRVLARSKAPAAPEPAPDGDGSFTLSLSEEQARALHLLPEQQAEVDAPADAQAEPDTTTAEATDGE